MYAFNSHLNIYCVNIQLEVTLDLILFLLVDTLDIHYSAYTHATTQFQIGLKSRMGF